MVLLTFSFIYIYIHTDQEESIALEVIAVINFDVEMDVVGDSEEQLDNVDFSWPAYYFMLALASLYLSMVLTDFVT